MKHCFDGILRQPCSLCFAFQALQLVVQLSEDWLKSSPAVQGGSLKKYTDVFDHPQDDRTRRFFLSTFVDLVPQFEKRAFHVVFSAERWR